MRYLLIDTNHLANRAVHVKAMADPDQWVGSGVMIMMQSLRKHYERFNADHLVMCFDSKSWRESIYENYKTNRRLDPNDGQDRTLRKIDAKKITHRVIDSMLEFFRDETNATTLQVDGAEADDFIGIWTQMHEGGENIIISGDSDLKQLVAEKTDMYDTMANVLYTRDGVFYQDGKRKDGADFINRYDSIWKVKLDPDGNPVKFDPEWELFLKCIKGDPRDNIRPAYPYVSMEKVRAAYADRGGVLWNNLINAMTGKGESVRCVRDAYEANRKLVDLSQQPEELREAMKIAIRTETTRESKQMVHVNFENFCERFKLSKLAENGVHLVPLLASSYS